MLNVYLPYSCPENFDSYQAYLGELYATCDSQDVYAVYVVGDFNAGRSNHFWQSLTEFCSYNKFVISDERLLPVDSFTYLSDSHNSTTWIDHCLSCASADQLKDRMKILHQYLISDHRPLLVLSTACPATLVKTIKTFTQTILNTSTGRHFVLLKK